MTHADNIHVCAEDALDLVLWIEWRQKDGYLLPADDNDEVYDKGRCKKVDAVDDQLQEKEEDELTTRMFTMFDSIKEAIHMLNRDVDATEDITERLNMLTDKVDVTNGDSRWDGKNSCNRCSI